ncbi:Domain of uncharacterised function DUF31 [Mycoplasmopsis maculosa]|uniref:Domain of uncharacterized function DUF31 n=1 Tax=Mycoplasmopsis maculosa TaxID=114885 RepID=A0A449B559_9BACT|nr:hypothetical protein [Mycoplasmopsis maculosa]VEU75741.1 Domain of uncharacterised function DUF31 [Mycoplasmopsis maculosa]
MKKRLINILKTSSLFSISGIVVACSPFENTSKEEVSSLIVDQNNLHIKISNIDINNAKNKVIKMELVSDSKKIIANKVNIIKSDELEAIFDISNLKSPATYLIKNIFLGETDILFKSTIKKMFSLKNNPENSKPSPEPTPTPPNEEKPSQSSPKPTPPSENQPTPPNEENPSNPPVYPGFGDEGNQPIFPPNFPKFDRTAENSYPAWASKFNKIDENTLYKEIYDRTFAVKFGINISKQANQRSFLSSSQGTTWLLDYHKFNENEYKLFFATNLHVMGDFSNSLSDEQNKLLNYEDYRGWKVDSISFGKTEVKQTNFPEKENRYAYSKQNDLKTIYYANANEFTNVSNTDSSAFKTKFTNGISSPKIVFAGFDFIDRQYLNEFQEGIKEQIKNRMKQLEREEQTEEDEYLGLKRAIDKNEFIPAYTDFGIFEVDINLSEMQEESLRSWFRDAITSVDQYIDRNKKASLLPNTDKSISSYMQTIDYITAINNPGNEANLSNAKDVFTGGYPSIGHGIAVWTRNNPTERKSETESSYNRATDKNSTNFAYPTNSQENRVTTNNLQLYTSVFGRPLMDFYGFNMTMRFSSLSYGASGSVVYNEFGQIIGIYNSVSADVSIDDLLREGRFASLLVSKDYKFGERTMKAYNLIDGTNKTLYPAQTASFRENLVKLYSNGFKDNSFTTALFPNGFKPTN